MKMLTTLVLAASLAFPTAGRTDTYRELMEFCDGLGDLAGTWQELRNLNVSGDSYYERAGSGYSPVLTVLIQGIIKDIFSGPVTNPNDTIRAVRARCLRDIG